MKVSFQCIHAIITKIFIIRCTWVITIIFRYNVCGRIVSKFNFLTRFLSRETFYFDNWNVHVKDFAKVLEFFLLKFFKVKIIALTWLYFPRHLTLGRTGQGQAALIITSWFSETFYNKIITFIFRKRTRMISVSRKKFFGTNHHYISQ